MERAGFVRRIVTGRPHRTRPLLFLLVVVVAAMAVGAAATAPAAYADGTLHVTAVDSVTHLPVSGGAVTIGRWESRLVAEGSLDANGDYSCNLPAGKYVVTVRDRSGVYVTLWWHDAIGPRSADPVTIKDGAETTCLFEMIVGGHLCGTVTDGQGDPLAGIDVGPLRLDPQDDRGCGRGATTDASGHYDAGAVPTGTYILAAADLTDTYLDQIFPNLHYTRAGATTFAIVAGQTTVAPTIVMQRAAAVSGAITTHSGVVPSEVMCRVDRRNDDGTWANHYSSSDCNNDCTYDIRQLAPGHYRLSFQWDENFYPENLPQYYKDTYWVDQAYQFDLTEGEHLTGMDAVIWGDDQAPTTLAPEAVAIRQGAIAGLRYEVRDTGRHGPRAAVTIVVKTRTGKVVKTIRMAHSPVNRLHLCRYTCALPKGTYRFCVYAIDSGGNRQKRIANNVLTVR
jgi:hypothetical protein